MKIIYKNSKQGLTLIEVILYIALVSFILIAVPSFAGTLISSRIKNQTIAEVEQQGAQIMNLMRQSITNAKKVNSPMRGTSSSSLSIDGTDVSNNPIVFSLSQNAITMTEGNNSPIQLTSQRLTATDLTFQNLSRNGTNGLIRIAITLTYTNPSGKNEFSYTQTFYTSVSVRS